MTNLRRDRPMPNAGVDIQIVLVPAGVEYQAVRRALKRIPNRPRIVAIPAGPQAVQRFLSNWAERPALVNAGILLVGLGGGLSPDYGIGDSVILQTLWDDTQPAQSKPSPCDRTLTTQLSKRLRLPLGVAVSCDRIVTKAAEKCQLRDRYGADVVEMEGAALLAALPDSQIAILRVISDDCDHDLPDISDAIGPDGSIQSIRLALSFLKHPVAAMRLIRGSLKGLKALEHQVRLLFQ